MDIQKWLSQTEGLSHEESGHIYKHNRLEQPRRSHKRKRSRERPISNDENEEVEDLKHRRRGAKDRHRLPLFCSSGRSNSVSGHSSSSSSSSKSFSSQPSSFQNGKSEIFERRKRHKTRKEIYVPNAGERKKRSKRKDEQKTMKRKNRHHKTERTKKSSRPGLTMIKSFNANNVPTSRLTLEPPTNLGLFKKGRASSPVKGRGLPDLVFSEMRFLQDPKEPETGLHNFLDKSMQTKHKSKKSRATNKQDEITAFFTGRQLPLKDKSHNISRVPAVVHQGSRNASWSHERRHTELEDEIKVKPSVGPSLVELPSKPFLGFGSRGNRPHSASYYSWSESPAPERHKSPTRFLSEFNTVEIGQLRIQPSGNPVRVAPSISHSPKVVSRSAASRGHEHTVRSTPRSQLRPEEPHETGDSEADQADSKADNALRLPPLAQKALTTSPKKASSPFSKLLQACDSATQGPSGQTGQQSQKRGPQANNSGSPELDAKSKTGPLTQTYDEGRHNGGTTRHANMADAHQHLTNEVSTRSQSQTQRPNYAVPDESSIAYPGNMRHYEHDAYIGHDIDRMETRHILNYIDGLTTPGWKRNSVTRRTSPNTIPQNRSMHVYLDPIIKENKQMEGRATQAYPPDLRYVGVPPSHMCRTSQPRYIPDLSVPRVNAVPERPDLAKLPYTDRHFEREYSSPAGEEVSFVPGYDEAVYDDSDYYDNTNENEYASFEKAFDDFEVAEVTNAGSWNGPEGELHPNHGHAQEARRHVQEDGVAPRGFWRPNRLY